MNKFRKPHGNGGRDGGARFGDRRPSRPGFDRPSRPQFGGARREAVELFDTICSKCGNACQVPFRPNGQKPVYCRGCFGSPSKGLAGRENFVRRDVPVNSFAPRNDNHEIIELKQQIDAMSVKIDRVLRMIEATPRPAASVAAAPLVASPKVAQEVIQKELPKKKVAKKKATTKTKK